MRPRDSEVEIWVPRLELEFPMRVSAEAATPYQRF